MGSNKKDSAKKLKKKRWYPIIAPKLFSERILGESYLVESSELKDKVLDLNLMNVTGDPKKQAINARFKVVKVLDAKGLTDLEALHILPASLRRVIRRGKDKINSSFLAITSDKRIVRIKPILITNSKTHNPVKTALRKQVKDLFIKEVYNLTLEDLFKVILTQELQRSIRANLSKTYPVKNFELSYIGLEPHKKYSGIENELAKQAEALGAIEYPAEKEKQKEMRKTAKVRKEQETKRRYRGSEENEMNVEYEKITIPGPAQKSNNEEENQPKEDIKNEE
ncbi:MAG: hypothetical protein V1659_05165 [Candidatus Woesearchaeota archaeon]